MYILCNLIPTKVVGVCHNAHVAHFLPHGDLLHPALIQCELLRYINVAGERKKTVKALRHVNIPVSVDLTGISR